MSRRILKLVLVLVFLVAPAAAQTDVAPGPGEEMEKVKAMISAAKRLMGASPGKELSSDDSPARRQVLELWEYGRSHASTAVGQRATEEALHLLVHLDRYAEVTAKAEGLAPQEPVWPRVMEILLEGANLSGDYAFVLRKAEERLRVAADPQSRARLWFTLGQARQQSDTKEAAISAYRRAAEEAPGSDLAIQAEGYVHELSSLNRGQIAPSFAASSLGGEPIALESYRGKVVLMSVWASW